MIARSPEEREQYEARRKAERDHNWRIRIAEAKGMSLGLEQGIEQGREQGVAEGRKANQVQAVQKLQRILNLPVAADAELLVLEIAELDRLYDVLLAELASST